MTNKKQIKYTKEREKDKKRERVREIARCESTSPEWEWESDSAICSRSHLSLHPLLSEPATYTLHAFALPRTFLRRSRSDRPNSSLAPSHLVWSRFSNFVVLLFVARSSSPFTRITLQKENTLLYFVYPNVDILNPNNHFSTWSKYNVLVSAKGFFILFLTECEI